MKKLVQKIGILTIGVIFICILYFGLFLTCVPPQYTEVYTASLIDKEERLLSIKEPKIILVGNSNLAFGIHSEMIEEAIGMPVVNMGLHGGLGNKILERFALQGIGPNDLVIICHSDFGDDGKIKQTDLAWITIENHKDIWKALDMQECFQLIEAFPDYAFNATSLWLSGRGNQSSDQYYSRNSFNEYGDNASMRKHTNLSLNENSLIFPQISKECVQRLNWMNEFCREKGATMVVAGYPIIECEYTKSVEEYAVFQEKLEEALECEIISDYEEYRFPLELFFDGPLHLTSEGAEVRTQQMIIDIQNYLENQNESTN